MTARHGARVWFGLGTIYVVWGSTFIALAIAVRDLPPFLAMSLRHLTAGALLLAFALPRGDRAADPVGRRQVASAFVFGGLLFVTGHGALAWAQQTVPAGMAALIVGSIPIWMALFDPFGGGSVDRVAALVIVLSAMCWAAGSLYSRAAPLPHRPLVSAGLASLCGGLLLGVLAAVTGEIGRAHWTQDAILAVGYLVVAGSLVGFTTYVWLLRVAPVSLVSTYAYVNPVVAVVLGWALLGEAITLQMVLAGAAVLVSVALIVRAGRATVAPGRGLLRRRPVALSAASEPTA